MLLFLFFLSSTPIERASWISLFFFFFRPTLITIYQVLDFWKLLPFCSNCWHSNPDFQYSHEHTYDGNFENQIRILREFIFAFGDECKTMSGKAEILEPKTTNQIVEFHVNFAFLSAEYFRTFLALFCIPLRIHFARIPHFLAAEKRYIYV